MASTPEDKMLAGATNPECDASRSCHYRPTSYTDYVRHLERDHPEQGKVNG